MLNPTSLDSLCASLAYSMGIDAPVSAAPADARMTAYLDTALGGTKADRLVLFNPDAVAQWIYEKYPQLMKDVIARTELALPYRTVMPSVTPVCFATFYSGTQPEVHGIRKYEKPVLTVDTLFDALIRAGKRIAIVADTACSIGKIFLERPMDYFLYETRAEINAKAISLLMEDHYDVIVLYNGNYDSVMHKYGPESVEALAELHANNDMYAMIDELVKTRWTHHTTLLGFAMDHGCHEIDGGCGSHGLDMEEDLNIVHLYKAYPAAK